MKDVVFARSRSLSLGVELEFQVLDGQTLDLADKVPELLARVPDTIRGRVVPEFMRSILEIRTGICHTVREVAADLRRSIHLMEDEAAALGCLFYSASLHPFAEPAAQKLSQGERYHRIMQELQQVGRHFIAQGLHIHVGMEDGETAIAVCDTLQAYLPLLLGLSGSSPYFRGIDTGLASYRTKLFEALPLAGIAGYLGSWQAYLDEITLLRRVRVIREIKDLWWDVRPSPEFGTVEVRICDLPARFVEVLGLTTMVRALAAALAEGRVRPRRISPQLLRWNKWQAARHGLAGQFTDPLGLLPTETQTIDSAVREMMSILAPWFDRNGDQGLTAIAGILEEGISASRQRALMRRTGSFIEMIKQMRDVYWNEDNEPGRCRHRS